MDNATVLNALKTKFGDKILHDVEFRKQLIVWVAPDALVDICTYLRDAPQFTYKFLSDVSALDRLTMQQESFPDFDRQRFVVNYQLLSMANKHRVWLKVSLPADNPTVASVASVWATANFLEREVYDLMGIKFEGHPNLQRILMPEDWEGHPLRKDYPVAYEEVQFSHNFDRIEKQKKYAKR